MVARKVSPDGLGRNSRFRIDEPGDRAQHGGRSNSQRWLPAERFGDEGVVCCFAHPLFDEPGHVEFHGCVSTICSPRACNARRIPVRGCRSRWLVPTPEPLVGSEAKTSFDFATINASHGLILREAGKPIVVMTFEFEDDRIRVLRP
jgi:hypothetical protein